MIYKSIFKTADTSEIKKQKYKSQVNSYNKNNELLKYVIIKLKYL